MNPQTSFYVRQRRTGNDGWETLLTPQDGAFCTQSYVHRHAKRHKRKPMQFAEYHGRPDHDAFNTTTITTTITIKVIKRDCLSEKEVPETQTPEEIWVSLQSNNNNNEIPPQLRYHSDLSIDCRHCFAWSSFCIKEVVRWASLFIGRASTFLYVRSVRRRSEASAVLCQHISPLMRTPSAFSTLLNARLLITHHESNKTDQKIGAL